MNYLIVCTGNTCRSPMAEALMRQYLKKGEEVQSAGVAVDEDKPMSVLAVRVLAEKGIEFRKRATPLSQRLIQWANIVLCVEPRQSAAILIDYPEAQGKTYALAAWAGETETDLPDPYGGTMEDFRESRDLLDRLIQQGLARFG